MELFSFGFIQVAGIRNLSEATLLMNCGVRYLGFPLSLPVHQEDLSRASAKAIIKNFRPPCYPVLITYLNDAEEIKEFSTYLGVKIVQLHGEISLAQLANLRSPIPKLKIIKSLIVKEHNEGDLLNLLKLYEPLVDAFITDTFDPRTGATGATGKTHDWLISQLLVESCDLPIILAGGLTPDNVEEAILTVKPAGIDVHTGVENERGYKDRVLVKKFMANAKNAFNKLLNLRV